MIIYDVEIVIQKWIKNKYFIDNFSLFKLIWNTHRKYEIKVSVNMLFKNTYNSFY